MAKAKYTKGSDGYFQTKVWDGTYDEFGKKHRIPLRSKKSSADLEKKVNKFKADVEQRKNVRITDISFLEYARAWKKVYKTGNGYNTNSMYDNIIEKHFPAIANVRLQDIERIHIQMLLNNASGKERTQQQILMTFKQVLRSAVSDHLFPANIMEDIFLNTESVKYSAKEKRTLTDYEKKAVFSADFNEQDKIFVYILYGCGLRREEALALTIFDFSLKDKTITINKAHVFVHDKPVKKEPKTKNGYRTLPIPDMIFPAVESYIKHLKSSGKVYLFTMRGGKLMSKSSYDKMWARIIKRMREQSEEKIENLTAHIFRHNYCTNLCYQIPSISIKKIAYLMGDTEAVVLKVYNHMILEKENADSAVNNAMNF